jgi:hypothetical protein
MALLTAVHPRFWGLPPFQFLAGSFIAEPSHQIQLVVGIGSEKNGGHQYVMMPSIFADYF